jgi:uncharacterized repeat protein (TIGR01451 family)
MLSSHSSRPYKFGLNLLLAVITITGLLLSQAQPVPVQAADPTPGPSEALVARSYKAASKPMLTLGETMTYTIHLELGWFASLSGEVTDPIPAGLDYVPGSASFGGVYDPATRTLTWSQVPVGYPKPIDLTFDVKDVANVNVPTPVVNTATISFNGFVFQRQAWVTLMPESPGESNLSGSYKSAWPRMISAGDTVTYSITLLNTGSSPVIVQVVDPVPAILKYVPGSADHGGVYDDTTRTITWKDIVVQPYNQLLPVMPMRLNFKATAPDVLPASSIRPMVITNTASISTTAFSFKRSADILLITYPIPPLAGSFKTASQRVVQPGQEFSYMIYLQNSSPIPQKASVKDPLPVQVNYVDGSANAGGVYDPTTRTVSWENLTVLEGSTLMLTFKVIAISPIANAIRILNTAYIASGGLTLQRSVTVILQQQPGGDHIPPVVNRFTIDEQDVITNPEVTLHIAASDNVGVKLMYLKEWALFTEPFPHWQLVNESGWIPYQAAYPWKLSPQSGSHYMAVWVADAARNKSVLTRAAVDFASLLLPSAHVPLGGMVPYMVYYPAGVDVKAELQTLSGAAHLFVWYPGSLFLPDETSSVPNSDIQTITFTTRTAGIYLFLVYGLQTSEYDLRIAPGGGPRLPIPTPYNATSAGGIRFDPQSGSPSLTTVDGIDFNPILLQSMLDPLEIAQDPDGPFITMFMPAIMR